MKGNRDNRFSPVSALVGSQIGNYLEDPELSPEPDAIQQIIRQRWGKCAGPAADASFPLLFRDGRLVIFTESAIWATELRHQQQSIIDQLAEFDIRRIEVKPRPAKDVNSKKQWKNAEISETSRRHLRTTAQKVRHEGLREALNKLSNSGNSSSDA